MMVKAFGLNHLVMKVARHQLVKILAGSGSNPAPATTLIFLSTQPLCRFLSLAGT